MSKHLVIFDLQHKGKRSRPDDRGISADLDGDGRIALNEREANLTPVYVEHARWLLSHAERDIDVQVLTQGDYAQRWACAAELAKDIEGQAIYVACHLNGGARWPINWGLVLHDPRSWRGRSAASALGRELEKVFRLRGWPITEVKVSAASKASGYGRALNTIEGIYRGPGNLCGVCYEPFSLTDLPEFARSPARLKDIGSALAYGCHDYLLGSS